MARDPRRKDIQKDELILSSAEPQPSKHVTDNRAALGCWDEITALLREQGNLTANDTIAIELAATVLATYRRLEAELRSQPLFVTTAKGDTKTNPLISELATYATKLSKSLNDLRLTPVTRSKAVAPNFSQAEVDAWTVR